MSFDTFQWMNYTTLTCTGIYIYRERIKKNKEREIKRGKMKTKKEKQNRLFDKDKE